MLFTLGWELRVAGIAESGALLGPVDGSLLGSFEPGILQCSAILTPGGACIFWPEIDQNLDWTIWARRVDSSGIPTSPRVAIVSPPVSRYASLSGRAVENGAGGFFVAHVLVTGELKLEHFPAGSNAADASVIVANAVTRYSLHPNQQGGALVAWRLGDDLFIGRFNVQCVNEWAATSANPIASPLAFDSWPPVFGVVPTASGGAIVTHQRDLPRPSRVFVQCLDSQGIRMGSAIPVSSTPGDQALPLTTIYPLAVECAPNIAGLLWLANSGDLLAQRIGCCGREPTNGEVVPYPPRLFCEIPVDLPTIHYGGFNLNLPCGDRDRSWGVLPLDQLSRIPGIDSPGFLSSRDTPRPDWVAIQFLGIPETVNVTLLDAFGKLVAKGEPLPNDPELPNRESRGRVLLFEPQSHLNYVLMFEGKVDSARRTFVSVRVRFGENRDPHGNA